MYGDDMLVAPITSANDANGNGSVSVWVPPGSWTDYFTGATYTGPSTVTITAPLSRMPVLIKAGGLVPTRTDYVNSQQDSVASRLTVDVAAGADGSFSLYADAGEGTGYQSGASTTTPLAWADGSRTFTIGATTGSFPAHRRAGRTRCGSADRPPALARRDRAPDWPRSCCGASGPAGRCPDACPGLRFVSGYASPGTYSGGRSACGRSTSRRGGSESWTVRPDQ
jgi:hypothetical protein